METIRLTLDDIVNDPAGWGRVGNCSCEEIDRTHHTNSVDIPYDVHVMELAAYVHDWGAFPRYSKKVWNMLFARVRWWKKNFCMFGFELNAKKHFARNDRTP